MIAFKKLRVKPALDAYPRAIQKINFTENLDRYQNTNGETINVNTTIFLSQGTLRFM